MSTTVTYKDNTLTTVNNATKTLKTAGKYMEDDIVITDISNNVYQDENGYLVLDEGNAPAAPASTEWTRPSDWPDLSKMDISSGDIIYMTSYADEARGFCSFYVNCTGSYTVEIGTISGTTFTVEKTETQTSGNYVNLYYGSVNGTYKVLRVTGDTITKLYFKYENPVTIGTFNGYSSNQGIIDIVGKIPSCTSLYFYRQYNIVNIELGTLSLTGNIYNMFSGCYSLTSLDVSNWSTANVTNMNNMFYNCTSLISLDVSNWSTVNVTDMNNMFYNCRSLISLDVSNWSTANVTNTSSMFCNCYSLVSLDVSNWSIANVTNTSNMFSGCYSLTSLDVSNWSTDNVIYMNNMFSYCTSLTSLDVSNWSTDNVTNMSYMFYYCTSLTSLNVSNWSTVNVTNMNNMFSYCTCLISLNVSNWSTANVTNMGYIFYYCYSLTSLDVSNWSTANVTNMSNMFSGCYSLTSLDVSDFNFVKITTASNTQNMFRFCYGLYKSITIPATCAYIGSYCFSDCRNLTEWHFLSTTPPTLANTNAFNYMTDFNGKKIYVPVASVTAYKTAENWSTYANYIVGE